MSYINADELLPPELLQELQSYVQGSLIYIPREDGEKRLEWGARSGARESFDRRNAEIRAAKAQGRKIDELADEYGLSPGGIRKILYGNSRKRIA
jgi:Mor family transcriptional regulator